MMLQVKKYEILDGGKANIEFLFDRNRNFGIEKSTTNCDTINQADATIISMARESILQRLDRFVLNIQRVANAEKVWYQLNGKDKIIEFIIEKLHDLNQKEFEAVAKNTIWLNTFLVKILPTPTHPQYQALGNDLSEIIQFAENYKMIINPLLQSVA